MYKNRLERKFGLDRRRQTGITFPSHQQQAYVLLARFDLHGSSTCSDIRRGLKSLCSIFDMINECQSQAPVDGDELSYAFLSSYSFSATIGFGKGFFDKLDIAESKVPPKLYGMPNNLELSDPKGYTINQTDLILQLASNNDFINRWVFYYSHLVPDYFLGFQNRSQTTERNSRSYETPIADVVSTLKGWTILRDIHMGFQRLDGRNLMGFYDGISNPRGKKLEETVWINESDEDAQFKDGTYMVFQKIEHDLELWRTIPVDEQEQMMGRSKATGLLLGTLQKVDDEKLAIELHSKNRYRRSRAKRRLDRFMSLQRDPDHKIYDNPNFRDIDKETPITSHVRLSNPRVSKGGQEHRIFRRGYLYSGVGQAGNLISGLLFISFQKDIRLGFEELKRKFGKSYKDMLNSPNNPNLGKSQLFQRVRTHSKNYPKSEELTIAPPTTDQGDAGTNVVTNIGHLASITIGGGYYFVPPIPQRQMQNIGEQFF